MKVIGPIEEGLVGEGEHPAVIEARIRRRTRQGWLLFYKLRITAGEYGGRELDYLIPKHLSMNSSLCEFVVSALGRVIEGDETDDERLVGKACVIRVKHIVWKKNRRTYAKIVSVSPPAKVAGGKRGRKP